MSFHVGQQVVCVDDGPAHNGLPSGLMAGRVYTVAIICPPGRPSPVTGSWVVDTCEGIGLEGVTAPIGGFVNTGLYRSVRFRPVKQTSIEIFQQMLVNPPKEVVS